TWVDAGTGLSNTLITTLAIDPAHPSTLYAGAFPLTAGTLPPPETLFKTTDGGANWIARNTGMPCCIAVTAVAADPPAADILYAGTNAGVFKSTNGAMTWVSMNAGLPTSVGALLLQPGNPSALYAGTSSGVFKSTDGAATWIPLNTGWPAGVGVDA